MGNHLQKHTDMLHPHVTVPPFICKPLTVLQAIQPRCMLAFAHPAQRRHRGELHEVHIGRDVDACFVCFVIACVHGRGCGKISRVVDGSDCPCSKRDSGKRSSLLHDEEDRYARAKISY